MGMNKADPEFFDLLVQNYRRLLGAEPVFLADPPHSAQLLYEDAAMCVLAHSTETVPRFIYANRAAQSCFEYDWDELIGLPSHFSADDADRAERQRLLDAVARDGFATKPKSVLFPKTSNRLSR